MLDAPELIHDRTAKPTSLTVLELFALVERLSNEGDVEFIKTVYRDWISAHQQHHLLYAVCFNYASFLTNLGDLIEAKPLLQMAISENPGFMPSQINYGFVLERLGDLSSAVSQWLQAVNSLNAITADSISHKLAAFRQIARVFESVQLRSNAEDILRQSLGLAPDQRDVIQHWVNLRQGQCKWPVIEAWADVTEARLIAGMSPLSLAVHTDDPMLQLGHAAMYSRIELAQPAPRRDSGILKSVPSATSKKLRVGYLSSDLRQHAIGYLMAEIFGLHDHSAIDIFIYNSGPPTTDAISARARAHCHHWLDIAALTDEAAARAIRADAIDILVDVNGHTHGARPRLLAMRPAPAIVNWLGFPGSTGSPVHNYLIADDIIVPPELELYYSEKILRLPCYQPNDRQRLVSARTPTRADVGLPGDAVVFCCFNGTHKFNRAVWQRWMTILRHVEGSVLWLLDIGEDIRMTLGRHAEDHGIGRDRLVYAARIANAEHLARYPLADLFLDTAPYGAHTTASDALWMGVPVLTLCGRSFAARVCSSLVTSAGLPDMVCTSAEDYVRRAVDLGRSPEALAALKSRLRASRDSCRLFDTPRLVAELENLYRRISHDVKTSQVPRPDLANLDLYQEIGLALQDRDPTQLDEHAYRAQYHEQMALRDAYAMTRPDNRLWPSTGSSVTPATSPTR